MTNAYLYTANDREKPFNVHYPNCISVESPGDLAQALKNDYVCCEYKENRRSNENFLAATMCGMDCDNSESEDPKDWKVPEDVATAFPNVPFYVHYSRNDMKVKNGKPARPKFHVLFIMNECTDGEAYSELKRHVQAHFPAFDANALDAARYFNGTEKPKIDFYTGTMMLDDYMKACGTKAPQAKKGKSRKSSKPKNDTAHQVVSEKKMSQLPVASRYPEGSRNQGMFKEALFLQKKHGCSETIFLSFVQKNEQMCDPPLALDELSSIWKSAMRYAVSQQVDPSYIPPELYSRMDACKPDDFTDFSEACVMKRLQGDTILYSEGTDFMSYNGTKWVEDKSAVRRKVQQLALLQKTHAQKMKRESARLVEQGIPYMYDQDPWSSAAPQISTAVEVAQETWAEQYLKFALGRLSSSAIDHTMKELAALSNFDPATLDADEKLLCTPHGTYDLTEGLTSRRDNTPEDLISKATRYAPGDTGKQIWQEALGVFFGGDQELIDYVQMVVGEMAFGRVHNERLTIAYGDGGNGKSTFWNTICAVMGDYSGAMSSDVLIKSKFTNNKPQLAELRSKRIVIAGELEEGQALSTSLLKQITSTDPITAEKKYCAPFQFIPSHSCVLYTNYLPSVTACDNGTWRRLQVIPFTAGISADKNVTNYGQKLEKDAGEAIMAWIIEGAHKASVCGFHYEPPACVKDAAAAYREESDSVARFITACTTAQKGSSVGAKDLFTHYTSFCEQNGETALTTSGFKSAMTGKGYVQKARKQGNVWLDVILTPDTPF